MDLTSDQRRKWVLEKIVNNFENYPEISDKTWYKVDVQEIDPSPETQRDIVEKILGVFNAIKILSRKKSRGGENASEKKANWYDIKIISPEFDELCEEHGIKFQRRINKKDCHYVSIQESRTITLDDKYKLSKPNLASENDHFFLYVFNNPDKVIKAEEIEANVNATIGKKFGNILNDLGFKGEVRKLFFATSKDAVLFRNFIQKDNLEYFGVNQKELERQISKLKKLEL